MIEIEVASIGELVKKMNDNRDSLSKFMVTIKFYLTQSHLQQLAQSNLGIHMEDLNITPEYNDTELHILDFAKVSFPNLKSLSIRFQSIKAIHFTKENTPILKSLSIEQPIDRDVQYFNMDLPELETMMVEFLTCNDPSGFGKSLSSSPKLRFFSGYKLWGLGVPKRKTHILILPSCENLDLYRSYDLTYLKIWAPKLEELNFQACYDITEVKILDRKPNGYTGPEYSFIGTPSSYEVNLINTSKPKGNVTTHQRCKKVLDNYDELMEMV